jgi:hypothetical protein
MFTPWAPHTYDFVVLTSLTHPRKIILVVLQIGKARELSAPLLIIVITIQFEFFRFLYVFCFAT